jgi:WD40 repeat protein
MLELKTFGHSIGRLKEVQHRAQFSPTLRGHESGASSAAFSPDGQRVVTASWDKTARL